MEKKYARFFIELVNELIKDNGDKEKLFDALREYQLRQDLEMLLLSMQEVLDEPFKLELFEHMRPLVLLSHQMEYSGRIPSVPGVKARIVRLRRRPGEGLGFAVRGGLEHGVGVFVTDVKQGSQAARQGLMIGDEILGVNGFTISEAIHDEVLNLIKSKDDIVLKVTHIGMLPQKEDPSADVKWKYANEKSEGDSNKPRNLKIFIDSTGHHSIGCGILSGPSYLPGIFVERVRPDSLAEEVKLEPGDQIVEVNGTSFHRITHKEAVLAMVSSRQLHITIRKGMGTKLIGQVPRAAKKEPNGGGDVQKRLSNETKETALSIHPTIGKAESHAVPTTQEPTNTNKEPRSSTVVIEDGSENSAGEMRTSSSSPSPSSSSLVTTKVEIHSDKSSTSSLSLNEVTNQTTERDDEDRSEVNARAGNGWEVKQRLEASPLSGAAAFMQQRKLQNIKTPELLGRGEEVQFRFSEEVSNKVYDMFNSSELDGRPLKSLTYSKKMDLGVSFEGGLGSPLNGKVVVAMLFDDGVARKSGKMSMGDQVMAVNGARLIDVTATRAEFIIQDAATSAQETVELIFCASTLVNEEESMTYF